MLLLRWAYNVVLVVRYKSSSSQNFFTICEVHSFCLFVCCGVEESFEVGMYKSEAAAISSAIASVVGQ